MNGKEIIVNDALEGLSDLITITAEETEDVRNALSKLYEEAMDNGKQSVLADPSAYDLFSHQERD